MFPLGQHPIYSHTEEDRLIVYNSLGLKPAEVKKDVEAVKEWFHKQPHLVEAGIDSRSIELYILIAKGSVERAKQRIDWYYRLKVDAPEVQDRVKLLKTLYRPVWDTHVFAPAPKLYNGSRVTYAKIYDWNKFTIEECVVNICMLLDIRIANDFAGNETWIIDLEHATLKQILTLNFFSLSRAYRIIHEGLGMRILNIHVINCTMTTMMQAIMNLCKPFMSKKVQERLKFHSSSAALNDYLPSEYIPKDYGGDMPSFEVYKERMEEFITNEKTKTFLLESCKIVSDESKRIKSEYNEDCLEGNFKKLDFD